MDKSYNFHISKQESQAIQILRKHDINISRFLRMSLRDLAEKLRCQAEKEQKTENYKEVPL
jgi:hypothetical protein